MQTAVLVLGEIMRRIRYHVQFLLGQHSNFNIKKIKDEKFNQVIYKFIDGFVHAFM